MIKEKYMFTKTSSFTSTVMIIISFMLLCPAILYADPPDPSFYNNAGGQPRTQVGTIKGASPSLFTGALQTGVSIQVPPGRLGIAPSLNLGYNSQGGNGWIGMGWNMDLGTIQRNTKNGIDYSASDYVFGGSELVSVDPDKCGSGEEEFMAKYEQNFDIFCLSSDGNSWTVYSKTGNIAEYGKVNTARIEDTVGIFAWKLNKVTDTNGNYMEVLYVKHDDIPYLEYINYTGNSDTNPVIETSSEVRFYLEDRDDDPDSYSTGFKTQMTKRLKTIAVSSLENTVRAYSFVYDPQYSASTRRSLLKSVYQYGNDVVLDTQTGEISDGSVLPVFENASYTSWQQEFYGDNGYGPQVWVGDEQQSAKAFTTDNLTPGDINRVTTGDFNGDGMTDIYRINGYGDNENDSIFFALGNGNFSNAVTGPPTYVSESTSSCDIRYTEMDIRRVKFGDFNGDGMTDIYRVNGFGAQQSFYDNVYLSVLDENGDWYYESHIQTGPGTWVDTKCDSPELSRIRLADFNNDGMTDVYRVEGWGSSKKDHFWLSNGDGTFTFHKNKGPDTYVANNDTVAKDDINRIRIGDFNGDGYQDIYRIMTKNEVLKPDQVFFYNGATTDFYNAPAQALQTWVGLTTRMSDLSRMKTGDFNGDGLTDLYRVEGNYSTANDSILISRGDGSFQYKGGAGPATWVEPAENNLSAISTARLRIADFNSDGMADVYHVNGHGTALADSIWTSSGSALDIGNPLPGPDTFVTWPSYDKIEDFNRLRFGDFNGDGLLDVARVNGLGTTENMSIWLSKPTYPDLLESYTNSYGGTVSVSYEPSTIYQNTQLHFPMQTVSSVTTDDDNGNIQTVTYDYEAGYFDTFEKEFLGFGRTTQISPDGSIVDTWHHQYDDPVLLMDRDFMGMVYNTTSYNSSDEFLSGTVIYWDKASVISPAAYPMFIKQTGVDSRDRIGSVDNILSTWNTYDDTNGFLLSTTVSGADAESITTTNTYTQDPGSTWLFRNTQTSTFGSVSGEVSRATSVYESITGNKASEKFWLLGDPGNSPVVSYTYYPEGSLKEVANSNGETTAFEYDSGTKTFTTKITLPETGGVPHISTAAYDSGTGNILSSFDENGNKSKDIHDPFGRVVESFSYEGNEVSVLGHVMTEYSDILEPGVFPLYVTSKTDAGSGEYIESKTLIDRLGRNIQSTSYGVGGEEIVSLVYYDDMGRAWKTEGPFIADASGNPPSLYPWKETTFDDFGKPVSIVSPDEEHGTIISSVAYNGYDTTVTDPDGRKTKTRKDYLGRAIRVTEDVGGSNLVTDYQYNVSGNLITVTDAKGNQTIITYDSLGRKLAMVDPDMGYWQYSYDSLGNLIEQIDARSQKTTMFYDELDRLTDKVYNSTSAPDVTYTYDTATNGIGRLSGTSNTDVTKTVDAYDALGRVTNTTILITGDSTPRENTISYDLAGRTTSMTYPDGFSLAFNYFSGTPLLYTATGSDSVVYVTYSNYGAMGSPGQMDYGNGTSTIYGYDQLSSRLANIVTSSPIAGNIVFKTYSYSAAGNVEFIYDSVDSKTYAYAYDNLRRLTSEAVNSITSVSYTYDEIGNIESKTLGAVVFDHTPHATRPHALQSVAIGGSTYNFAYDNNGNMTSGYDLADTANVGLRNTVFNAFNKPSSITYTGSSTSTVDFIYDGDGQRSKKSYGSTDTYYFGPHFQVEGASTVKYVIVGGKRIARIDGVSTYYYHQDHLGSSAVMTIQDGQNDGNIVETTSYMPFGGVREHTGTNVTSYKYTGQEHDAETGLYNYNARFYDPAIGIFISPDTIVPNHMNPQSLNRYSYVLNNPLMYIDPSGHFFDPISIIIGGAVIGALVSGYQSDWDPAVMIQGAMIGAVAGTAGYAAGVALGPGAAYAPLVGGIASGAASGAMASFMYGGNTIDAILKGALYGGIGGAAFGTIDSVYGGEWTYSRVVIHGVAGHQLATLQGGDAEFAFAVAAFSAASRLFHEKTKEAVADHTRAVGDGDADSLNNYDDSGNLYVDGGTYGGGYNKAGGSHWYSNVPALKNLFNAVAYIHDALALPNYDNGHLSYDNAAFGVYSFVSVGPAIAMTAGMLTANSYQPMLYNHQPR
jgi:RHS repeat-associated protein